MTIRSTASRLLAVAALSGGLAAAPMIAAPSSGATNCPGGTVADPITGVCWSQTKGITGLSGTGGTCLPGRLGLCLGALQNSQIPGANLQPQAPAGANRVWP